MHMCVCVGVCVFFQREPIYIIACVNYMYTCTCVCVGVCVFFSKSCASLLSCEPPDRRHIDRGMGLRSQHGDM